jgi:hypothetical protein
MHEAVSLQNFCGGKTLLQLFPSPDPTRVGASGTGSALFMQNSHLCTFIHTSGQARVRHAHVQKMVIRKGGITVKISRNNNAHSR